MLIILIFSHQLNFLSVFITLKHFTNLHSIYDILWRFHTAHNMDNIMNIVHRNQGTQKMTWFNFSSCIMNQVVKTSLTGRNSAAETLKGVISTPLYFSSFLRPYGNTLVCHYIEIFFYSFCLWGGGWAATQLPNESHMEAYSQL